jgi:hypothetical protein
MRDALNDLGSAVLTGHASNPVYLDNVIDFGPIDARAQARTHRTGEQHDSTVILSTSAALAAALAVNLQHSDDNSTFTDLVTPAPVASGTPAGTIAVLPFPLEHKRYVRVKAVGGTASVILRAWFEPGPNH